MRIKKYITLLFITALIIITIFAVGNFAKTTIPVVNIFNVIKSKSDEIINELKNGKNISLVSDAGTPCISDPGYILIKKARENNIEVIGIPGCSAIIDALSISGLDTSSFTFYGFVPTDNKSKDELFNEIKIIKKLRV